MILDVKIKWIVEDNWVAEWVGKGNCDGWMHVKSLDLRTEMEWIWKVKYNFFVCKEDLALFNRFMLQIYRLLCHAAIFCFIDPCT